MHCIVNEMTFRSLRVGYARGDFLLETLMSDVTLVGIDLGLEGLARAEPNVWRGH